MSRNSAIFATTRWTLIDEVDGPDGKTALDELCQRYWRPVVGYLKRAGASEADAEDLAQDFFIEFMARDGFAKAEKERGRFRSFLLRCVKNHQTNAWKAKNAIKRGGAIEFTPVDEDIDVTTGLSPEQLFDKQWAEALIDHALLTLRNEWESAGRPFELLAPYLSGDRGVPQFSETAEKMGVSLSATKSAVHRLRKRLGELVKKEIENTIGSQEEAQEELDYLLQLLSRQ